MIRRILIEVDMDENSTIANDIAALVISRMDSNVEFSISQEIVPERSSRGIKIPEFVNTKNCTKQKGMMQNG